MLPYELVKKHSVAFLVDAGHLSEFGAFLSSASFAGKVGDVVAR
jgi:hypothetical protein